jgi:hypothetical protein
MGETASQDGDVVSARDCADLGFNVRTIELIFRPQSAADETSWRVRIAPIYNEKLDTISRVMLWQTANASTTLQAGKVWFVIGSFNRIGVVREHIAPELRAC